MKLSTFYNPSEFFKLVNNVFDVQNSRVPNGATVKLRSGFGREPTYDEQLKVIDKFYSVCNAWKKEHVSFSEGLFNVHNSIAAKTLCASYVLTSRANQVSLENICQVFEELGTSMTTQLLQR